MCVRTCNGELKPRPAAEGEIDTPGEPAGVGRLLPSASLVLSHLPSLADHWGQLLPLGTSPTWALDTGLIFQLTKCFNLPDYSLSSQ